MNLYRKLLLSIIGMIACSAIAQNADSVIVIYDNQKTIVPLPAFGSKTSVSFADTNKVVEIGVWIRKPGEPSLLSQLYFDEVTTGKPKNKSKWFSEIEAGYIRGYYSSQGEGTSISSSWGTGIPRTTITETSSRSLRKGYQIRLSVMEGEFYLNEKSSIISGFKLGFSQSFMQAHSYGNVTDSTGKELRSFDNHYNFRINSFQFLYQFGISYHFNVGKLPSRINVGNSLGVLRINTKNNNQEYYGGSFYASLLQPYFGMEIWKMGVLFSTDLALPNNNYRILNHNLGGNISVALTYRIF